MNRVLILIGIAFASAVRGIRRASTTSLLAVATIAVVLCLAGSAWLLIGNMAQRLDAFGAELTLTAYLEPELDETSQRALVERARALAGVERVALVTKEAALARFERMAGSAELLAGLDENPLPAALELSLAPAARTRATIASLAAELDRWPGVELAQGQDWVEGYARALDVVRSLATGLGCVLAAAALLIVANTIRLAIYARRDELDILALVGASRTFVRVPFLLEGALQGLLGGLAALAIVYGVYAAFAPRLAHALELVLGRADLVFFTTAQALALVAAGALLGLFGSVTALVGWKGTT